jgi:hypothetical protein
LGGPGGDEPGTGLCQPADEAATGEHGESGDEHPATPEEVGGPAAEHEESGEGQGVRVHHPLLTDH